MHMHSGVGELEFAEKLASLNYSNQKLMERSWDLCNIKLYGGSVSHSPLLPTLSFPPSENSCSVDEPGALLPFVLHGSLQQNQYLRTICAAPRWLGFDAPAPPSVSTVFRKTKKELPGTDSNLVPGHQYLTRKSPECTVCTFTIAVLDNQLCSREATHYSAQHSTCASL